MHVDLTNEETAALTQEPHDIVESDRYPFSPRIQVEPDPGEMAGRYGAETPVLDWRERLVCSRCGTRQTDMMVTGEHR